MIEELPVDKLTPWLGQPRKYFCKGAIASLAEQFLTKDENGKPRGVLSSLVVRPKKEGYEIICGERRWRAALIACLETVPCRVIECDDIEALEIAGVENIQREDLNCLEMLALVQDVIKNRNCTVEFAASRLSISRVRAQNILKLSHLSEDAKKLIELNFVSESEFKLTQAHCEEASRLQVNLQLKFLQMVIKYKWDTKTFRKKVSDSLELFGIKKPVESTRVDADINALNISLSEKIGSTVEVINYDSEKVVFGIHPVGLASLIEKSLLNPPYEIVTMANASIVVRTSGRNFDALIKKLNC